MNKRKTNEQMLRSLLKDLDPLESGILRERIVLICEQTLKQVKETPEQFDNPVFNHTFYESVCNKVEKHLGFEK